MWNEKKEESMKHATYKMIAFWVDLIMKRYLKAAYAENKAAVILSRYEQKQRHMYQDHRKICSVSVVSSQILDPRIPTVRLWLWMSLSKTCVIRT